jgi:pyruvate ferredoxin oxidoreductase alpha subunit
MLVRDSGAIQLFAENAQEAYDYTVMAPRIAEHPDVLLPVLVGQDGFTITHSAEPVRLLEDGDVKRFVGEYSVPFPLLDLGQVTSQGPFAMPDSYFELRHDLVRAQRAALDVIDEVAAEFAELSGRHIGAIEEYELEGAERVLVVMGSSAGTTKDVVDELRAEGEAVGLLQVRSFRPFPDAAVRAALKNVKAVAVLDRADSPGGRPPLFAEVATAAYGGPPVVRSFVYGLGGRDLHPEDIRGVFASVENAGRETQYVSLRSDA